MDFLTEDEKQKLLIAQLKKVELETIIRFRELGKHIDEGLEIDIKFLSEKELKEYKNAKLEILRIKEVEESQRSEVIKHRKSKVLDEKSLLHKTIPCEIEQGVWVCKLFVMTGLCKSLNEAKKLIKQKGLSINKKIIDDTDKIISNKDALHFSILLQRGKKQFHQIVIDQG